MDGDLVDGPLSATVDKLYPLPTPVIRLCIKEAAALDGL